MSVFQRTFLADHSNGSQQRHSIWGARILPYQNQVLVVRLIYRDADYTTAFEIFDIPEWGVSAEEPAPIQQQVFESPPTSSLVVSEMSTVQPATDHPTRDEMLENRFYAAPISIVAHIAQPRGFIHWTIQPELMSDPRSIPKPSVTNPLNDTVAAPLIPSTPPTRIVSRPTLTSHSYSSTGISSEDDDTLVPIYSLPAVKVLTFQFEKADQKTSAIPGLSRMLLWTRPAESRADCPPMLNLFGYITQRRMPQGLWTPDPGYLAYQAAQQAQAQAQVQARAQVHVQAHMQAQVQTQAHAPANDNAIAEPNTLPTPINGGIPAGITTGIQNRPHLQPPGAPPPTSLATQPPPPLPVGRLSGRLFNLPMPQDFIEEVQSSTQSVAFEESSGKIGIVAGKAQLLFLLDTGGF
jgi:hypothetical protein